MGPIGCPETSIRNYHYSLRNKPEELSSTLQFTEIKCKSLQSVLLPLDRDHNVFRPVDLARLLSPKRVVGDYLIEKKKTRKRLCVEKKNQLYVTVCFIALMICSTCFGHFYAHHQEL